MPKDLWKPKKRRSNAQKETAHTNFATRQKYRPSDKENHNAASQKLVLSLQRNISAIRTKLSNTEVRLQKETEKTMEARRLYNNTRRREKRKQEVEDGLREELEEEKRLRIEAEEITKEAEEATKEAKEREGVAHEAEIRSGKVVATLKRKHHATKMKLLRALKGKKSTEASLSKLTNTVTSTPRLQLKEKGAFTEGTRELVRELVNCGLPVDQVNGAIQAMSAHNGLEMQDTISTRTIGRIILEGGIVTTARYNTSILRRDLFGITFW